MDDLIPFIEPLREIVATNNKQRNEFSEDMTRIRARQGHSIHQRNYAFMHPMGTTRTPSSRW
ncbi:MAG: RNA 2'-phosphotransferase [Bacteroidales bacterium]|nr:RNA 2'-phosphotransferase [Bacteroidales bacterium]